MNKFFRKPAYDSWNSTVIPYGELERRISFFKEQLSKMGVGCALITQNADRYYYTGTVQDGILMIHADHQPVLFIKRTLSRAREESPIRNVLEMRRLDDIRGYMDDNNLIVDRIGITMDVVPAKLYMNIASLFTGVSFVDISKSVRMQRAVKSVHELALLREGGVRFDRVLEKLKGYIRVGISEYELYMVFTHLLLEEGSSLFVRTRTYNMEAEPKYILSGESAWKMSAMDSPTASGDGISRAFPGGAGRREIGENEPLIVDAVFVYEGYMVDCTRVYAMGRLDNHFTHAHGVSMRCHEIFKKRAVPGTHIPGLYREILEYVRSEGLEDVFMGGVRFIGHGVGLELDEFPVIAESFEGYLERGMVVALEPKFVFKDGCVGLENTYTIDDGDAKPLTLSPEDIQYL
ncbi:MAG: M24 family metallopeptidase [Spirochaetota bacterium]